MAKQFVRIDVESTYCLRNYFAKLRISDYTKKNEEQNRNHLTIEIKDYKSPVENLVELSSCYQA